MKKTSEKERLIHPNSRKALKLVKTNNKKLKRERRKQQGCFRFKILADRFQWVKSQMSDEKIFTHEDVQVLIQRYIDRHQYLIDEPIVVASLAKLSGKRRVVMETKLRELQEFQQQGFEFPDLCDEDTVLNLRVWDGAVEQVQSVRTKRFISRHTASGAS